MGPNAPGRSPESFLYRQLQASVSREGRLLPAKRMKQLNPPFSRTHRAVLVARIVFLLALVAGIVFVAARSNFTSRASDKTTITTTPSDKGPNTPSSKAYASAPKTSTLVPLCTTDPVVVNNSDSGAGSLRQAIADACDASTITFNMAMVTSPISLTTAELSINKNLTITGPGSGLLTIARSSAGGTPQFRIFNIGSGTVNISGVTVTNGTPTASTPDGGGIVNSSTLTLTDVIISGNFAGVGLPGDATGGGGGVGGGIYNGGTLTMTNCSVNGNTAGKGGDGSGVGGNGGNGGGLYNTASLTMTSCSVNGNTAGKGGTGGTTKGGEGGWGGALYNRANLSMTDCVISGNAGGLGGDGGGFVSGGNGGAIEAISGTTTLAGVIMSNNSAGDTGGNGGGGNGGAIDIVGTAVVMLTNSTVSGNRSGTSAFGGPGFGGGISTQNTLVVTGSTISNNTTGSVGGGIATHNSLASLKITNSTVSGNHAPGSGGGIADDGGLLEATNCTITNNSFTGLSTSGSHTRVLINSIVAGNGAGADLEGIFTSQGNNLIGKSDGSNGFTNGSNGDKVGTAAAPLNPLLAPLANYGGPTQTHSLLAGSPAIDAGENCVLTNSCSPPALASAITTDQRGFSRSADGNGDGAATVDIGAFEVQSILVTNTNDSGTGSLRQAITDANANAGSDSITFLAGLTGSITLLTALPDLSTPMSINGPGALLLTVRRSSAGGTPSFRILNVQGGNTITISGLTIANGSPAGLGNQVGGGIFNGGTLTLNNCQLSGSAAAPGVGTGGAIFNNSGAVLTLTNSTVSGNSATGGGGILNSGTLSITNSTLSGNVAGANGGGAIYNNGPLILTNSTVSGNFGGGGAGIFNSSSGTVTVANTTVSGNFGGGSGGAGIFNGGAFTLVNTTVSGNSSPNIAGGIYNGAGNLTLTNVTITNNRSDSDNSGSEQGGGLFCGGGTVILRNTIVAGNFRGTGSTADDISGSVDSTSSFNLIGLGGTGGLQNTVNGNKVVSDPHLGSLANNGGPTLTHALLPQSLALDAGSNALITNPPFVGSSPFTDQRGPGFKRILDSADVDTVQTVDIGAFEANPMIMAIPDATFDEDFSADCMGYSVGDDTEGFTSIVGTSSNQSLLKDSNLHANVPNQPGSRCLAFSLEPNQFGTMTITVTVNGTNGQSVSDSFLLTVNPVADTPSVTNATTTINTQTTSGLVLSRNSVDGAEVTHFKITNIQNGALFKNDGTTQIMNGALITFAEGNAGLKFTPTHNLVSPSSNFSFQAQGATSGTGNGLSPAATATITVTCGASDIVTNTNDGGAGSLRNAIANACPGDTVTFNIPTSDPGFSGGLYTITLTSTELLIDKNLTITGPGANALTISGNNASRVFEIQAGVTVTIANLTITNGKVISGNSAGGILNNGTLTLQSCTISGNSAANAGGGILNNGANSTAVLTIVNSTISGNHAPSFGAGIFTTGFQGSATLTIVNSTISGNGSPSFGGGIYNFGDSGVANLNITNSTIAGNTAGSSGGGIFNQGNNGSAVVTLANTIVSNNTGPNAANGPDIFSFLGTVLGNNNLIQTTTGYTISGSNNINADPMLEKDGVGNLVLKANGGPTMTHLLLLGSPARDAGSNNLARDQNGVLLTTDQRGAGFNRIINTTVDIGAVEVNYSITATAGTPQSVPINTAFSTQLQATVKESGTNQSGIPVTFTAPSSGASGTFPGGVTTVIINTDGSGVATPPAFTANGIAGGPYNVVASLVGGSPSANFSLTNLKGNQTITVNTHAPANATYNSQFTVAATASSGLAVGYSSSGSCANVGANFTMTSGTGTCTVMYNQAGDANYNAATQVTESVTAQKANQTINFGALLTKTFGDADFGVSATATSNLAISFTASGQCTVTGTNVHITGAGSCTITAKQSGDSNFNAAPDVPQSFNIAKATTTTAVTSSVNLSEFGQSVTFTATVTSGAGTPTGTIQFKDGAANIGSAQTLNAGGVAQLTTSVLTTGTHTITADYNGDANFLISSGTLSGGQVVKAQPTLSINDVSMAEGNSGTTNFVFTVTLSAASNLTVNVDYATANGTATIADNDYQAVSGTLTFNPGNLTRTITVLVNGDQKFEPDETFFVNLTNAVNATISDSQGVGTIQNDDTLQLILEESGPDPNQAAAFDSMLFVRDPFHVQSVASWLDLGPDRNTRVLVFVKNLQLNQGETASAVVVHLVDNSNQSYDVTAEDVRPVPNFDVAQVTFRLPDNLASGGCMVTVKAHSQVSNTGTIRIVP